MEAYFQSHLGGLVQLSSLTTTVKLGLEVFSMGVCQRMNGPMAISYPLRFIMVFVSRASILEWFAISQVSIYVRKF